MTSLRAVSQLAEAFVREPVEGIINLRERVAERGEGHAPNGFMPWPPCPYQEDADWEEKLHGSLGLPWPCGCVEEFFALWRVVMDEFGRRNVKVGRGAFGGWGDGDSGLVRSVWSVLRHRRPATVLETGVARGFTTRFILKALERNHTGHLWSIDLPPPRSRDLHREIGAAVPRSLRSRWSYVRGSSRRRLRGVLSVIGELDVFVHDSRHSGRNVLFELGQTWNRLRPGGVLIVDDIDLNWGFHNFRAETPEARTLVCLGEPLEPDFGRHLDRGLFAVVVKNDERRP